MSEALNCKMPAIFFGHGSPGNVLEDNVATKLWQQLGENLARPKGIICISAHWYLGLALRLSHRLSQI